MLVIGGGPVGLAAAIGLRMATDLAVVVAEAGGEPQERFGESLPPDILLALDRLGLADAFRAGGHLPCPGSISVWGREQPGHNDFILNPMGPAWHIDRVRFEAMLRARAIDVGATIRTRARAVGVARASDGFAVALRHASGDERAVRAGRVLDASGSRAWFARRQGATRREHDRMLAVVRFARIAAGTFTSQTVVEATRDGWWYCARLPEDRIVTVLVTERREARSLTRDGYARWHRLLAATTLLAPRLQVCGLDGERFRTSAVGSSMLDRVEGRGWLAIGDAASALDPIASRGIHQALADAADATRVIAAAAGHAEPPPWRYEDRVAERFEDYLANRAHVYALEQRWPDAPFWQRRAGDPEILRVPES